MDPETKQEFRKLNKEIGKILSQKADKADLEKFATKSDLEKFATKVDLKRYATKADLDIVEYRLSKDISWLKENMFTRDDFMQYMVLFDEMATEVKEARREQQLFASRFVDLDDTVNNHEKRIRVLESN